MQLENDDLGNQVVQSYPGDAQSAFQHNPECRAWRHRLSVPCRGGIKDQTSLLALLDQQYSGHIELENADPVDDRHLVKMFTESGSTAANLDRRGLIQQKSQTVIVRETPDSGHA